MGVGKKRIILSKMENTVVQRRQLNVLVLRINLETQLNQTLNSGMLKGKALDIMTIVWQKRKEIEIFTKLIIMENVIIKDVLILMMAHMDPGDFAQNIAHMRMQQILLKIQKREKNIMRDCKKNLKKQNGKMQNGYVHFVR